MTGHRSSVTRIISQLKNALESGDRRKLRQIKQSLTEKSSILATLDREMIEVTEDKQLESEIEQSDLIQEEISLALISIEETLEAITAPTEGPHRQRHTEGTHSLESGEVNLPAASHSSKSSSEGNMTPVTTSLVTAPSVPEVQLIPGATSSTVPALLPSSTLIGRLLPTSGASSLTAASSPIAWHRVYLCKWIIRCQHRFVTPFVWFDALAICCIAPPVKCAIPPNGC